MYLQKHRKYLTMDYWNPISNCGYIYPDRELVQLIFGSDDSTISTYAAHNGQHSYITGTTIHVQTPLLRSLYMLECVPDTNNVRQAAINWTSTCLLLLYAPVILLPHVMAIYSKISGTTISVPLICSGSWLLIGFIHRDGHSPADG